MPTKRTHRSRVRQLPLTPAWRWTLLTGELCTDRIDGWVAQAHDADRGADGWDYTPHGDALWLEHGKALTTEAQAAGFTPYWATGIEPIGAPVTAWRYAFLATYAH